MPKIMESLIYTWYISHDDVHCCDDEKIDDDYFQIMHNKKPDNDYFLTL